MSKFYADVRVRSIWHCSREFPTKLSCPHHEGVHWPLYLSILVAIVSTRRPVLGICSCKTEATHFPRNDVYFSHIFVGKYSFSLSSNENQCELSLTLSHTVTPINASGKEAFSKHCGKRGNCLYKQFLLSPQCFVLFQRQKLSFLLHLICHLQMLSIWSGPNFVVWEWVK